MNNNLGKNDPVSTPWRTAVDENFERNAKVKIHKGRESYSGGSGFYASKPQLHCPNVNDGGHCDLISNETK